MRSRLARNGVFCCMSLGMVLLFFPEEAGAFFLKNGDFELGNLSGWKAYETPNGSLGGQGFPDCVDFDIRGDGHVTKSAEFKVGQQHYQAKGQSLAGGGIFTNLELKKGTIIVTLDMASSYSSPSPKDRRNLAGGLFELLVDGEVIASHDVGPIPNNTTQRSTMEGLAHISAGVHEVRIRIRRPFRSLPHDHAPRQYLDNIQLTFSPF